MRRRNFLKNLATLSAGAAFSPAAVAAALPRKEGLLSEEGYTPEIENILSTISFSKKHGKPLVDLARRDRTRIFLSGLSYTNKMAYYVGNEIHVNQDLCFKGQVAKAIHELEHKRQDANGYFIPSRELRPRDKILLGKFAEASACVKEMLVIDDLEKETGIGFDEHYIKQDPDYAPLYFSFKAMQKENGGDVLESARHIFDRWFDLDVGKTYVRGYMNGYWKFFYEDLPALRRKKRGRDIEWGSTRITEKDLLPFGQTDLGNYLTSDDVHRYAGINCLTSTSGAEAELKALEKEYDLRQLKKEESKMPTRIDPRVTFGPLGRGP